MAGLKTRPFVAACERGEIPVPLVRVGSRRFVRSADLVLWLWPTQAPPTATDQPNADLF